jgi:protein tyrosine/serine phosphatase
MNVKKYVGNGKKVGTYDLVNFTISEEKARESWIDYNGKKYLKLTIGAKKEVDQYGKTHTIWVDEYKPEQQAQPQQKEETDLPF